MYYNTGRGKKVDWSHRGDYLQERHKVALAWVEEALLDPERVVLEPDPASKSGRGMRVIGYSPTAEGLLTTILLEHEGTVHGVNGWRSNSTDQRRYREEAP